ncbi:hypothetical protein GF312_07265 [Candidatus Poribacteria bacterium]|nr:hypothetical protein [Candidatus Poribacteria bacterium]
MWKSIRKCSLIVLLITLVAVFSTQGSEPVKKVLDNGLTIIVKENHAAPVVSLRVYVKAGSMYEGKYMGRGITHNLEHLMFSGTETRTREQIDQIMEDIGNISNAYTTKDHTSYYITTASLFFDTALDLLSDYIQNPTFPEEEVEAERGVILNEINIGKDNPSRQLYNLFARTMFREHPAKHPVIGYKELFVKTTREDILDYYSQMYVPNNMIFVVVGDVDSQVAMGKIERTFQDLQRGPTPDFRLPDEPQQVARRYAEKEMDVQMVYMMMGFRTVDIAHKDLYPLDVLAFIMGTGRSSRLYKTIKDEKQLVYTISSWSYTPEYEDGGYFGINAVLDPDNIEETEKAVIDELYRLKTEYVTYEEIEKAKSLKESEHIFSQQTVEDQAENIGLDYLTTGDMNFSQRYLEGIKSVTKEDIKRVVNEYFYDDNLIVAVVKPKSPVSEEVTEEKPSEKLKSKVNKTVLDNGIKLLVKENDVVPLVTMYAMFLGGVRFEDEDKTGVSNFMSDMLLKGTESRTAQQLNEEIESMGGLIDNFSGNNSFGVSVSVLKQDMEKGLEILADVLMNPTFTQEEMEKKRKEILAAIKQQEDSPFSLAAKLFKQTLFQKHPYRFQTTGTEETISNISREDLVEFHDKYCVPNNMVLAIFGDIDRDEVVNEVNKVFADFRKSEFQTPVIPEEPPLTEIRKEEIEKDIQQVVIQMGFPGMKVDSQDIYAIQVLDAVLSGISYPGGRLHDRLRSNQIVYVVHAYNQPGLDPGLFAIYAGTTSDRMEDAMNIIIEEIKNVQSGAITDEEIERGKRMCIAVKQIGLQTNSDQAFTMGLDELYNLGYDNINSYENQINSVTKEDLERVAKKYLDLNRYAIAVVKPIQKAQGE